MSSVSQIRRFASIAWCVCGILVPLLVCSTAVGREWRLPGGGGVVNAKIIGLDTSAVILVDAAGRKHVIKIQELARPDLSYLKDILAVKQASMSKRSLSLQQESVNIQTAARCFAWYDLWVVQFSGPRGPFWRMVPARNSDQATYAARRMNPRAQLLWVQRFGRK